MEIALIAGARRVVLIREHLCYDRAPKLVPRRTSPLTGVGSVDRVVTDLGVFDVSPDGSGLLLVELAPEFSSATTEAATAARPRLGDRRSG